MIFSSIFFIFVFLPIVLILYYIVPFAGKNLVLLIASLIFYAWGEPVYVILMLLSIGINFVSGMELESHINAGNMAKAKSACIVTAVINFLIMALVIFLLVKLLNKLMEIGRKPEPPAGGGRRPHIADTGLCAADRYFLLHVPDHVLCDRCVPRQSESAA